MKVLKKRTENASESQKSIILEFIKTNPEIVKSKLSNTVTRELINKKWDSITSCLNAMPDGARKTKAQWKRVSK